MPAFLLKQNVFKYCQDTKQIPLYCCQAFTLFQKSFRKCREIYLTDQAIYVVSRKKLKIRITLKSIMKAYVGLLAGEFFIVSDKKNLIIDCAEGRAKFIENIKIIAQNCQIEYVNYTMLDFLFQKHKKISTKVKLTQYDDNQKKVQLKYFTGEKLNLRDLRKKWEQKSSSKDNKVQQKQKQYELTHVILTSTYWGIFSCVHKQTKKSYVAKIYSKKFIGMQQKLCNEILNQRKFSQSLSTLYTPSLVKAFYSTSNIYFIHEEWNGYLFEQFKTVKKQKFVNLFAQIVIAIGQLHQAGIVFCNLRKQDIMITLDGYVFFYNLSKSMLKGEKCQLESNLKPPEYLQNQTADFGWDWWNLAQFIYEVVEKRPFYENKNDEEIEKYLKSTSDKFPPWMKLQKWQKDEHLLHLFELLIRKKPQQRLGHKNDYHEILHLKYFQDWLKEYSKSDIMKKKCPPIFKKVIRPSQKQRKSGDIEKEFIKQQDWSEMNSYLKDFQYSRDVE